MPTHRLTLLYKIPRHHEFKATQAFMVITIRNFSSSFDYFSYTLGNDLSGHRSLSQGME